MGVSLGFASGVRSLIERPVYLALRTRFVVVATDWTPVLISGGAGQVWRQSEVDAAYRDKEEW